MQGIVFCLGGTFFDIMHERIKLQVKSNSVDTNTLKRLRYVPFSAQWLNQSKSLFHDQLSQIRDSM